MTNAAKKPKPNKKAKKKVAKKKRKPAKKKNSKAEKKASAEPGGGLTKFFGPPKLNERGEPVLDVLTGQPERYPPLDEYVEQLLAFRRRGEIVRQCCPIFNCSPVTVDRAIRRAKQTYEDLLKPGKEERVGKSLAQIEVMINEARLAGKYSAARALIDLKHKLMGDLGPDIQNNILAMFGGMQESEVIIEAEALRERALQSQSRRSSLLPGGSGPG